MNFPDFVAAFFALFAGSAFNGRTYLDYLAAPQPGDEAAVVDAAVTAPILSLLGFAPAEQVYNLAKNGDRPDFAPNPSGVGTCFFVEDKNTALELDLALGDPKSHLSQLRRYAAANGVSLGWLTNGRRLQVYRFADSRDAAPLLLAELNALRDLGYTIKQTRKGEPIIAIPYDHLIAELQRADPSYPVLTLFNARFAGVWSLPDACAARRTDTAIAENVFSPTRFPDTLVLKHKLLWLEVPDDAYRRYLARLLRLPRYTGRTLAALEPDALVPSDPTALQSLFDAEAREIARVQALQAKVAAIDSEIDNRVLDLYGITDPADRLRVLGAASATEDEVVGESEVSPPV